MRADGSAVLILRAAGKRLELEPGKAAIMVDKGKLVETLEVILEGTIAGEMDEVLAALGGRKIQKKQPAAKASAKAPAQKAAVAA
jgi:hypothetical protein